MAFYHSHPGLFQEKSLLQNTQTAQSFRHTGEKRRGTYCREESSLLSIICLLTHPANSAFQFIFAREQPFLGKRLNSPLEDPNAAHIGEGLKLPFESDSKKSLLASYSQQPLRISWFFVRPRQVSVQESKSLFCPISKFARPVQGGTGVWLGRDHTSGAKPLRQLRRFQTPAFHAGHPAVLICHVS